MKKIFIIVAVAVTFMFLAASCMGPAGSKHMCQAKKIGNHR